MSTAWSASAWASWRQSVAIMLVAVGSPVARRNSAITSRAAFAEQRRERHAEVPAEQIEQRALESGDRVHARSQIEGLGTAAARVAVGEVALHAGEQGPHGADRLADQAGCGVGHDRADRRAAGRFADAGAA